MKDTTNSKYLFKILNNSWKKIVISLSELTIEKQKVRIIWIAAGLFFDDVINLLCKWE